MPSQPHRSHQDETHINIKYLIMEKIQLKQLVQTPTKPQWKNCNLLKVKLAHCIFLSNLWTEIHADFGVHLKHIHDHNWRSPVILLCSCYLQLKDLQSSLVPWCQFFFVCLFVFPPKTLLVEKQTNKQVIFPSRSSKGRALYF